MNDVSTNISIVIPTYNSQETIRACLDSIINQDYKNIEIIVIDGLSKDKTLPILKEYAALYANIKFISEKDEGIYDAMNKGMVLAKGEWIYFLGSDDKLYHSSVLSDIFKVDRSSQKIVYGNVKVIGDTTWTKDGDVYDGIFDFKKILQKNICHQAIFYKRSFIQSHIGFYNGAYKLCSDWDFNLRCWAKHEFVYVDLIICYFYGGGLTTKTNVDKEFALHFKRNLVKYFGLKKLKAGLSKNELMRLDLVSDKSIISKIKLSIYKLKRRAFKKLV